MTPFAEKKTMFPIKIQLKVYSAHKLFIKYIYQIRNSLDGLLKCIHYGKFYVYDSMFLKHIVLITHRLTSDFQTLEVGACLYEFTYSMEDFFG